MTVLGTFGKILLFYDIPRNFEKHKPKKTFEKVQKNFMKILLKLQKYIPQISVRIFRKKF